jgi:ribonuclease HI
MIKKYKIFTDGGSRGNPGIAGAGFVVFDQGDEKIFEAGFFLGKKTNNEAEYLGFLRSLEWVRDQKLDNIDVTDWFLDSKLVVEQINKNWKIKEQRLKEIANDCWKILDTLPHLGKIAHIPREKNCLADALANKAMDSSSSFN